MMGWMRSRQSRKEKEDTDFQTTTFSAGTYLAFPFATLHSTVVVFNGVGIRITTLVAESLLLKFAFTVTVYETWVVPISVTVGMIRRGSLTLDVERYLGINENNKNAETRIITASVQTLHLVG
jgi:hypothetical protein